MADAVFPWETNASGKRPGRTAIVPPGVLVPFPVAQDLRKRTYLWLRRCPACGRTRAYPARSRTCSKSCGNVLGHFRASRALKLRRMLPTMQRLAVRARLANAERRIAERIAGKTSTEIYKLAYALGYTSGHAAGRQGYNRLRDRSIGVA